MASAKGDAPGSPSACSSRPPQRRSRRGRRGSRREAVRAGPRRARRPPPRPPRSPPASRSRGSRRAERGAQAGRRRRRSPRRARRAPRSRRRRGQAPRSSTGAPSPSSASQARESPPAVLEGAEVDADAPAGSVGTTPTTSSPDGRTLRGLAGGPDLVLERHRGNNTEVAETQGEGERTRPRRLFAPLGADVRPLRPAAVFRPGSALAAFLVASRAAGPGDTVLDVACGTGAVAVRAGAPVRLPGRRDRPEPGDARRGRRASRPPDSRAGSARAASAEGLPFEDESFDALTFTYLLRYVEDPAAVLAGARPGRLARRAGSRCSSSTCRGAVSPASLWDALRRRRPAGRGPAHLARLGPRSAASSGRASRVLRPLPAPHPPRPLGAAGIDEPQATLSLGGGVVVWGAVATESRSAPRSTRSPPEAGATRSRSCIRPTPRGTLATSRSARRSRRSSRSRLLPTLAAFFLAVGLGAHALDELHGRPLGTRLSDRVLAGLAAVSLGARSRSGSMRRSPGRVARSLRARRRLPRRRLQPRAGRRALPLDLWFALTWGAFPVLTAYLAVAERLDWAPALAAVFAAASSLAQRHLSTQVRDVRRRVRYVAGTIVRADGTEEPVTTGDADRRRRARSPDSHPCDRRPRPRTRHDAGDVIAPCPSPTNRPGRWRRTTLRPSCLRGRDEASFGRIMSASRPAPSGSPST